MASPMHLPTTCSNSRKDFLGAGAASLDFFPALDAEGELPALAFGDIFWLPALAGVVLLADLGGIVTLERSSKFYSSPYLDDDLPRRRWLERASKDSRGSRDAAKCR